MNGVHSIFLVGRLLSIPHRSRAQGEIKAHRREGLAMPKSETEGARAEIRFDLISCLYVTGVLVSLNLAKMTVEISFKDLRI